MRAIDFFWKANYKEDMEDGSKWIAFSQAHKHFISMHDDTEYSSMTSDRFHTVCGNLKIAASKKKFKRFNNERIYKMVEVRTSAINTAKLMF